MPVELRHVEPDELVAWRHTAMRAFGWSSPPAADQVAAAQFEPARSLVGVDGGQVVATSTNLGLRLALPGGRQVSMAGVSMVTVQATHRRQGVLNRMMAELLDDAVDHGEPVAGLIASEAPIYGRFGFGAAVFGAEVALDRARAVLHPPIEATGRVSLEEAGDVLPQLRGLWERWWPTCPGEVSRSEAFWQARYAADLERQGSGTVRLAALHHGPDDELDGYALYRVHGEWAAGNRPAGRVEVEALVALTPDARLELWSFLLGVDLVAEVRAQPVPLDEPLRHRLADLRQLRVVGVADRLWLRLLDVPTSLTARGYLASDRLVFQVADAVRPQTAGTYELDAAPEGAKCSRVGGAAPADLALSVADLGALWLGGVRAADLVAARRVDELTPGAAARADRLFAGDRAPFCATVF